MVERSALAFWFKYVRPEADEVALAQHGADCLCQVARMIWEVRLEEIIYSALQRVVDHRVGRMRACVRELLRCGQKGAIRVLLSTQPDLHLLGSRLDVSLRPESSATDPDIMRACTSRDAPPCFLGGLFRFGCGRGGGRASSLVFVADGSSRSSLRARSSSRRS